LIDSQRITQYFDTFDPSNFCLSVAYLPPVCKAERLQRIRREVQFAIG
jgi:hypothetical protein